MTKLLNLAREGLTELPDTIFDKVYLEELRLYSNQLTALPEQIGRLVNLRRLDLAANRLTELPAGIGQLRELQVLDLGGNALTRLPDEIGDLPHLQLLDVRDNRLTTLPSTLAPLLHSGQLTVRLGGNPLDEPILELWRRGGPGLAAYLRSLNDGVAQYEAKVLLVGEGNVGKTSLVAALNREPFVVNRPTTHGIRIRELPLPHPGLDTELTLRTWDFGGQEVYRVTHQFFFSQRALYLVVWHPRQGQEQNDVEGWLRRIRLRISDQATAIVVATHAGERRPELDYPRLRDRFSAILRGQYAVDSGTDAGIDDLRRAIAAEAAALPQMGQLLSVRWAAARAEILARAKTEPQIPFEEFATICRTHRIPDDETGPFAELLHELGQVIHYGDDDGLRDIVVLNPEWLTTAISLVLEDEAVRRADGVLDHAELRRIWRDRPDGARYPPVHHPFFLRLMEKFDISYRLADDDRHSLVAQLVPYERPTLPWEPSTPVPDGTRVFRLVCELDEPAPPGLVAWLTVRHHDASTGRHWRHGVFLRHPVEAYRSEALVELTRDQCLFIEVRAPSPDLLGNVLRDSVESLLARRWPGLTFRMLIPCPTQTPDGTPCIGRFPLAGLLRFRERADTSGTIAPGSTASADRFPGSTRWPLTVPCLTCQHDHDVSELLTGFAAQPVPLRQELDRLETRLVGIIGGMDRLERHAAQSTSYAAESANQLRQLVKAVSAEVNDCPRLFTVSPLTPEGWRRYWLGLGFGLGLTQRPVRLVLWCEHPGAWHAWEPAAYRIDQARQWLREAEPYLTLMFKTLRLIFPVAVSVADVTTPQLDRVRKELELMKVLLGTVPETIGQLDAGPRADEGLTVAEGAALRAFKTLLFRLDPNREFGGLSRVMTPAGEFLWVCPEHRPRHDPGLPVLPG